MAIIAYLFELQDEKDTVSQRAAIDEHAGRMNLRVDSHITVKVPARKGERKRWMEGLFANMNNWDGVIVADLCLTGSSVAEVVDIVSALSGRGIRLIAVRQGMDLGGPADARSKAMASVFEMLSRLEKEFISARIKGALAGRKKAGTVLGRPKGSISASKLDDKKDIIIEYLSKGVSKASLARILETSPSNLLSYLRTRKIETTRKVRQRKPSERAAGTGGLSESNAEKKSSRNDGAPYPAGQQRVPARDIEETHDVILCRHCGKNILDPRTTSCAGGYVDYQDNESHPRVPYPKDEKERCPRCGVEPGGYHHDGCYMERCPRCGERLVSCACKKV